MAYRFSDTSKWSDEWFIDLNAHQKLMFLYLCDNCDLGGFFELSTRKLSFDLGLNESEVKGALKGLERGYILSNDRRVLFLKNFIKHQKNLPLNPENKAHIGIFKRFENYKEKFSIDLLKLVNNEIKLSEKDIKSSENHGASKGLLSPIGIGNGIGNKIYNGIDFENFWNLYGKKVGDKKAVCKKWMALKIDVQNQILSILPAWKAQFSDKQFQPFPETFLNQQRWNDEIIPGNGPNKIENKGHPDYYSRQYEAKLETKDLAGYWAHLRKLGFTAKQNTLGNTTEWVKQN